MLQLSLELVLEDLQISCACRQFWASGFCGAAMRGAAGQLINLTVRRELA
jgi:hypothetical protein